MNDTKTSNKTAQQISAERDEFLECIRGLFSIHNSVTMGQERELSEKWWPVAKAIIDKHKDESFSDSATGAAS